MHEDVAKILEVAARRVEGLREASEEISALYTDLQAKLGDVLVLSHSSGQFEISMHGTRDDLKKVFNRMRFHGFEPDSRPAEKDPHYGTYFHKDEVCFWFNFSSTQCRRVQTGTETKEVPIYETICD